MTEKINFGDSQYFARIGYKFKFKKFSIIKYIKLVIVIKNVA